MRTVVAALAIALMTAGAQAQGASGPDFGGGRRQHHAKTDKTTTPKPKVDDKAYNAALKSLPDKPSDPWHGMR